MTRDKVEARFVHVCMGHRASKIDIERKSTKRKLEIEIREGKELMGWKENKFSSLK